MNTMKLRLTIIALICLCSASCVVRDRYEAAPNNNYYHGNNNYYSNSFDEEFNGSDLYGWTFVDAADSANGSIANGYYQYVDFSTTASSMIVVGTGIGVQGNFTATTRIKSNKIMGLIFGASSSDNGYAFYVDTAGNYSLYREGYGSTASTVIIPSTQDTLYALKNNWNIVQVQQANGTWTGYINGTQVFSMAASTLAGNGFGFKVLPGTTGFADYLQVQNN